MIARIPSVSLSRWGRPCLVLALTGLPLFASCTTSEDTEPFVPAAEGAKQPSGQGSLVAEDAACDELRTAAKAAYERLNCPPPTFPDCPGFLRPGGGSGCYEYYEDSLAACVKAYEEAGSCRVLSPCLVAAELNETLSTCQQPSSGEGGAGGSSGGASSAGAHNGGASSAGANSGGAVSSAAGSPGAGGAAGAAGQTAGGSP